MSTSGTYSTALENADFIEEAFERCGVDPDSITQRHLDSSLRSMTLLFSEWSTRGATQYRIEKIIFTSASGYGDGDLSLTLPTRVMRLVTAVHRGSDNQDIPITSIGREEYEDLVTKSEEGDRPDRYFLDRQRDASVIYFWPVLDNDSSSLLVSAVVRNEDVGYLNNSPDAAYHWWEALASGLAAKLAVKFAPERLNMLKTEAKDAFLLARGEDRDTGPVSFSFKWR